jgi:hypothetical protein
MKLERQKRTPPGERTKELLIVNGAEKKTPKAKTKTQGARRRRRSSSPARTSSPRRRARRRNPGTDVRGTLVAAGAGVAAALVGQMATHMSSRSISSRPARFAVRVAVPALIGVGGGMLLSKVSPTAGKACAAVGAGLSALHGLSEFTTGGAAPKVTLQKMGYGQLGSPDDVVMRDGQLLRVLPDGREELLQGLQGEPVQLLLEDNTYAPGVQLGALADASGVIVQDAAGVLHVIPSDGSMAGIEQAEQLGAAEAPAGGYEQAEQLGSDEEEAEQY